MHSDIHLILHRERASELRHRAATGAGSAAGAADPLAAPLAARHAPRTRLRVRLGRHLVAWGLRLAEEAPRAPRPV